MSLPSLPTHLPPAALLAALAPRLWQVLSLAVALLVLAATYLVFDHIVTAAPEGFVPRRIDIVLRPGQTTEIGRLHLMQPRGPAAAVDRHVRIARDAGGGWSISGATALRRVLLGFDGGASTFAHRWPLASGDVVHVAGAAIRFLAVDNATKRLAIEVRTATGTRRLDLVAGGTDQGRLSVADAATEPGWVGDCHPRILPVEVLVGLRHATAGLLDGWRWGERVLRRSQDRPRLQIGGVLSCRGGSDVPRLAAPGLEARELLVVERGGRFMLAPGTGQPPLVIQRAGCRVQGFREIAWAMTAGPTSGPASAALPARRTPAPSDACPPVAVTAADGFGHLTSLVLGRTRYDVTVAGDTLTLRPARAVAVLGRDEVAALEVQRRAAGLVDPLPPLRALREPARDIGLWLALRHMASEGGWWVRLVLLAPLAGLAVLMGLRRLPAWRLERAVLARRDDWRQRTLGSGLFVTSIGLSGLSTALLATTFPDALGSPAPGLVFALVLVNFALASLSMARLARRGPAPTLLWLCILVLVGTGLVNMAQLGFGADSTRFVELYTGQLQVFGLLPPAVIAAAHVRLGLVRRTAAPFLAMEPGGAGRAWPWQDALAGRRTPAFYLRRAALVLAATAWLAVLLALGALMLALTATAVMAGLGFEHAWLGADAAPLLLAGYAAATGLAAFIVYRLPLIAFSLKAAPLLAVTVMFLAWLALGGETGLGPFQPVELGKFAAVAFLSLFLIALDRQQDSRDPVVPLRLFLVYGAAVAFFIVLFAVVPALKSDYSPVLIVTLTSVLLVAIAGARQALRLVVGDWIWTWARRRLLWRRRLDAPGHLRAFRGRIVSLPFRRRPVPMAWLAFGFRGTAAGLVLTFGLFLVHGILAPYFWQDYAVARADLESRLATELVGKIAERVLSYRDLAYDRPRVADETGVRRPVVDYRDVGRQVILARQAIADAPCPTWSQLTGDVRRFLPVRMLLGAPAPAPRLPVRPITTAPARATAASFLGFACTTDPAGRLFGRNPDPVGRIPAVKDDFAAAFFVHTFGLRAAFALLAAQAALILVLVAGAFRVRRAAAGDHHERALRSALFGVMLGGAILFALHWAISWSNQLGLLPVMGQPMTFLSLGGSHLALMAFPLVLVAILGLRIVAEPGTRRAHFAPPDPDRRRTA